MNVESFLLKKMQNNLRVIFSGEELALQSSINPSLHSLYITYSSARLKVELRITALMYHTICYGLITSKLDGPLEIQFDSPMLLSFYLLQGSLHFAESDILPLQYRVGYFSFQRHKFDLRKEQEYEFVATGCRHLEKTLTTWPDVPSVCEMRECCYENKSVLLSTEPRVIPTGMLVHLTDLTHPGARTSPFDPLLSLRCLQLDVMYLNDIVAIPAAPCYQTLLLDRAQRARAYSLKNLSRHPTRKEILREIGTGARQLTEAFRHVYDKGSFEILQEDRMQLAWHWSKGGKMTIEEISAAVGYTRVGHFSQAFKKYWGVSPSDNKMNRVLSVAKQS